MDNIIERERAIQIKNLNRKGYRNNSFVVRPVQGFKSGSFS